METTRQNKISRLLQKSLVRYFCFRQKQCRCFGICKCCSYQPDMSIARVYLSVFPSEKAEEIVKNVNDNMKTIRYELGTRVRHQLRIIRS